MNDSIILIVALESLMNKNYIIIIREALVIIYVERIFWTTTNEGENSPYFCQRFESDTFTLLFRAKIDSVVKYIKILLIGGDNKYFSTM